MSTDKKHEIVTDVVMVSRVGTNVNTKHIQVPTQEIMEKAMKARAGNFDPYQIICRELINWGGLQAFDADPQPAGSIVHIFGGTICKGCTAEHNTFNMCIKINGKEAEEKRFRDMDAIRKLRARRLPGLFETLAIGKLAESQIECSSDPAEAMIKTLAELSMIKAFMH